MRDRVEVLMVGKKRIDRELIRLMGFEIVDLRFGGYLRTLEMKMIRDRDDEHEKGCLFILTP